MSVTSTETKCDLVTSRKSIDVEFLLEWTYRRQKADVIIGRGVGLNKIEAAASGVERHYSSGDWAAIDKYGHLGCFIDQLGFNSGQLATDAETVHETVSRFGDPVRGLLIQHGRAGTRPECALHADVRYEPVWKRSPRYDYKGLPARGSYKMIYDGSHNPVGCQVRPRQHVTYIEAQRRDYQVWHNGLVALAQHFVTHPLTRFVVGGPAAPAAPWD
ncbi:MAG: hypothetical protein ACTSWM_00870 [Alphaproteobacteria bacterium]